MNGLLDQGHQVLKIQNYLLDMHILLWEHMILLYKTGEEYN